MYQTEAQCCRARTDGRPMKLGVLFRLGVIALLLAAAYYFGVLGYFGLAMGEGRVSQRGQYWAMLIGANLCLLVALGMGIHLWTRRRR